MAELRPAAQRSGLPNFHESIRRVPIASQTLRREVIDLTTPDPTDQNHPEPAKALPPLVAAS